MPSFTTADIAARNEGYRRLLMDKNAKEFKLTVQREGEWEDPVMRSTNYDYLIDRGQTWLRGGTCEAFRVSPVDAFAVDVV